MEEEGVGWKRAGVCVCVGGGGLSCKRLMGDGSCPSITREGPADGRVMESSVHHSLGDF